MQSTLRIMHWVMFECDWVDIQRNLYLKFAMNMMFVNLKR